MKIIGVDVDLTVVDTVSPWTEWYFKLTGHDIGEITSENNDIENLMHNHSDPLLFWKDPKLYDELCPIYGAVETLQKLKDEGYEILFISSCFPEHETSKRLFLRRWFNFDHGFVSTSDKQYIKCDFFIDDFKKYCKLVSEKQPECKVFQINSGINNKSDFEFGNWDDFYDFVQKNS